MTPDPAPRSDDDLGDEPLGEPRDSVEGWLQLGAGYFLGDCFVEMYDPDALTVSHGEAEVAADDSGRAFLPDHTACMPLPVLRAILKQHDLAIVPAADVPSAEERKVLEAVSMVPTECLLDSEADPEITPDWYLKMVRAELSRRAAKEGK